MGNRFLEAGRIVNTHGIKGEIKIQPWTDTPDFLTGFKSLYIDGVQMNIVSSRTHKGCVITALEGITGVESAMKLKGGTVFIDRNEARLEEGRCFVVDLIGLSVINAETENELGKVADILKLPSNDVYVVNRTDGEPDSGTAGGNPREILIPAVPEFIIEKNPGAGYIKVRLLEGM